MLEYHSRQSEESKMMKANDIDQIKLTDAILQADKKKKKDQQKAAAKKPATKPAKK